MKGGTLLPHMVDVVARMQRGGFADNWTTFRVGKNRFGLSGRLVTFNHEPRGLKPVLVSDATNRMMQVCFDPKTGAERLRMPVPGSGGKTQELDGSGMPLTAPKVSLLRRIAALF